MSAQLLLLPAEEPSVAMWASISPCGRFRYKLGRMWDHRLPIILWILLNPSRADHERNDPTLLRVIHFSRNWGYGSAIVVNLFPLRTPSPAECRRWIDGNVAEMMDVQVENMAVIRRELQQAAAVVAAWGAVPWAFRAGEEIVRRCCEVDGRDLHCLGTTADGSPKHPLARGLHRVPDNQKPVIWRTA